MFNDFKIVTFLITLMLFRWYLPRPPGMKESTSYVQIITYASAAADVLELASYMDLKCILENIMLLRLIKGKFFKLFLNLEIQI